MRHDSAIDAGQVRSREVGRAGHGEGDGCVVRRRACVDVECQVDERAGQGREGGCARCGIDGDVEPADLGIVGVD